MILYHVFHVKKGTGSTGSQGKVGCGKKLVGVKWVYYTPSKIFREGG